MAAPIAKVEYACFARWTIGVTYAVGTREELRSGAWHQPYLARNLALERRFASGSGARGSSLDLVIADAPLGTFQTLVAGNIDGTSVTVETVCTTTLASGTTSTVTRTDVMTVQGTRLEPGRAVITLVDIEDPKLGTLYPSLLWSADTFRDMAQSETGRAIPHPIGTARKLRAALLSSDSTNAYYYYGVCEAPILTLAIVAINTGSKTFSVAGDYTDRISAGTIVFSSTSSANPGRYTVTGAVYSAPNTVVTVSEAIGSSTVSGNLIVPPTVLAVYRDGRVVDSSEYTVEMTWPVSTQMLDPDFDNSPADWSASNTGTGVASLTGGHGRVTGDGTTVNWARLIPSDSTVEAQRGAFYIATITLSTASSKLRLSNFSVTPDGSAVVSGAGTHTALVRQVSTAGVRRVDVSSYNTGYSGTVDFDDLRLNTTHRVLMVRFIRPQTDYNESAQVIEVDVRGVESRNVATEIGRVLTAAGCTIDATTFAAAETYATTHRMLVDCDHGSLVNGDSGSTGQRRISAIVADLLTIARGDTYRTSTGTYAIVQDKAGSSTMTLSEADGDLLAMASWQRPPMPSSVAISYLPNVVDPSRTTHTITRTVTGGVLAADKPIDVRYLTDHEAADRLLCYFALRREYGRMARLRAYLADINVGDVITVVSPDVGIHSAQPLWVKTTQQMEGGVDCTAIEYSANVHTYTAGTLPADAVTSYQPDYSKTLPAAPSALTITAGSVAIATDGTSTARITITATPPTVNWSELYAWCVHNTTSEITGMVRLDLVSGTIYGGTITGLRSGEVYQLKCDATNPFGVRGTVQGTFNATAIGGSGSATTFTAPGYATAPGNVATCTATQGVARTIEVNWTAVTTANLREYALEKKVATGAFAEIWRGRSRQYTDRDITIGTAYQYRVRAVDTYGNLSASYATSGSVTPTSNIVGGPSGGDIGSGTVDTSNRSAATGVSVTYNTTDVLAMSSGGVVGKTATHGLGKLPVVGACVYSGSGVLQLTPRAPTSTTVDIVAFGHPITPTDAASGAGSHQHTLSFSTVANGDTATIYVW